MSFLVATQPELHQVYEDDGRWTSEICDCCQDRRDCCYSCCCCPCLSCKTAESFGQCRGLHLLDLCGCAHPASMAIRLSVRRRYGIGGSLCRDCLVSTFCLPCVWCQISREVKQRELPFGLSDIIRR